MKTQEEMAVMHSGVILLADDDMVLLLIYKEVLEDMGYQVVTACNGLDAVKKYHQHRDSIKLAIFDVMMPQMNGTEAAKQIASVAPSLPFIFNTGCDCQDGLKGLTLAHGFQILSKPTDFQLFENIVEKYMCN